MTFSKNWYLVNHFSLDEAAALWCGLDPGPDPFSHPDVIPVKRFMEDEYARLLVKAGFGNLKEQMAWRNRGQLTSDAIMQKAREHAAKRGQTVSRQWLTELAQNMGVRPAFLFGQQVADRAPEMAVKTAPAKPPSMATTAELEDAYIKRREEWSSDKPTPSVSDDWDFLKTLKPDITRDRARKLRNKLAPKDWKQPGKRKIRG